MIVVVYIRVQYKITDLFPVLARLSKEPDILSRSVGFTNLVKAVMAQLKEYIHVDNNDHSDDMTDKSIERIHPMLHKRFFDIAHSDCYLDHEFTTHGVGVKFWSPLLFNFAAVTSSLTPTALSFQPPLLENERKLKDEKENPDGEYTHMCLMRSPHIDSIFRRSLYTDVHSTINYLAYSYSETKERGRMLLLEQKQSEMLKSAGMIIVIHRI